MQKITSAKLLKTKYFIWVVLAFAMASCKYTEHIPENQYLLWDQDVYENGDKNPSGNAESILKQQPNNKIPLIKIMPSVAIYNWGDGTDSSFWGKLGTAPVIFDSAKAEKATEQIRYYYFNEGYFGAKTAYDVEFRKRKRWAEVHYRVKTGPRFYLKEYSIDCETKHVKALIDFFSEESLIKVGEPYNANLLDAERVRLTDMLKNHGYYDFSKSYINYEADSTLGGHQVEVKMIVGQKPKSVGDTMLYVDHEQYTYNKIYVQPDYSYKDKKEPDDSLEYRKYTFIYDSLEYKPRYFTDAIHFRTGDTYKQKDVRDTYAHLVGYQAFAVTEIKLSEGEPDTSGPTLNALIHVKPLPKRTLSLEPEITTTNGYGGVNMSLNWVNRNIFGAGEALEIKLNGGIDYQPSLGGSRSSQTTEYGVEVGIRFPRFLLPFNTVGLMPKRMRPSSKVSVSANRTSRLEFDRETFGVRLSYFWNESNVKSYTVDLYDVTYSRLFKISDDFKASLTEFQSRSFQSELVSATRATFVYNGQLDADIKNPFFIRLSGEVAGTSLWLGESLATGSFDNEGTLDSIVGVPYYQYGRIEGDLRHYFRLGKGITWANRAYSGYILPYGNSVIEQDGVRLLQPPFSKFFYMGGSNDLRAWPAYRIGAGTQGNTNYTTGRDTSFAIGTVKFLASTELRFPIYGFFEGAVFLDAGNIFLTGGLQNAKGNEGTQLNLNDFLKNMALGTGFGLRLNLDYFILRADFGIKMYDPGLIGLRDPWVIKDVGPRLNNWTYNIALGYPF